MSKQLYGVHVFNDPLKSTVYCDVVPCWGKHTGNEYDGYKFCNNCENTVKENQMKGCVSTGSGRTYDIVYPTRGAEYTTSDKIPTGTMFTGKIGSMQGLYLKRGGVVVGLERDLSWTSVCNVSDYKPVQATITVKG